MCLNCGCGMPEEMHGNPKNITAEMIKDAAESNNMTLDQTKKNMIGALQGSKSENKVSSHAIKSAS